MKQSRRTQPEDAVKFRKPLVLLLTLAITAIVVGVATTALGLALVVRIRKEYGTIEEDDIHSQDETM